MNDTEVIQLVNNALDNFLDSSDTWLLKNDLSEQSISHRIALHLDALFTKYNVDCEYNGDVDRDNNKKAITILKDDLKEFGLLKDSEASELERELTSRAVFPDIIIHKRGSNDSNLCIIEVKKSTSTVSYNYDFIKLKTYTSDQYDNTLKYQLGIFLEAVIHLEKPFFKLTFFKEGSQIKAVDHES
ncbi:MULTISPECIES: hypothetical protein [Chryseobacterium]|uniref:hypothetical protein n=1 Tax=Chryseobacterium TaxID=59732 RepID=UPI001D143DDA|nr:hypothetical protein [Chryseobacterium sp. X308]MCC3215543.1 hypothetical protein [Chryseobacterium sp. X308]